jgi:hypothetical protein
MSSLRKLISDQAGRRQDTMRGVIIAVNVAARTAHVKIKKQNSTGAINNRGVAYLSYPADSGQSAIYLSKLDGFSIGDYVSVSSGLAIQEAFRIQNIEETTYIYLNMGDYFDSKQFGRTGSYNITCSDTTGLIGTVQSLGSINPKNPQGRVTAGRVPGRFSVSSVFTDSSVPGALPEAPIVTNFWVLDPQNPLLPAPITGNPYTFRKVTLNGTLKYNHPKKATIVGDRVAEQGDNVYFLPGVDAQGNPIRVPQNLSKIAQTDETGLFLADQENFMVLKDVPLLSVGGTLSYAQVGLPVLLGFAGGNTAQYSVIGPSGLLDEFSPATDKGGNNHSLRIDIDEMVVFVKTGGITFIPFFPFGGDYGNHTASNNSGTEGSPYLLVKNGNILKANKDAGGPYFDGSIHLEKGKEAEIAIKFVVRSVKPKNNRPTVDPLLARYQYIQPPTSVTLTNGQTIPVVFNKGVPTNPVTNLPLSPNPFDPGSNPYRVQAQSITNLGSQGIPKSSLSYTSTNQGFMWRAWRYDPNWPVPVLDDIYPKTVVTTYKTNSVDSQDFYFNTTPQSLTDDLMQAFTRTGQLPFDYIDPMRPTVTHVKSRENSSTYSPNIGPKYNIMPIGSIRTNFLEPSDIDPAIIDPNNPQYIGCFGLDSTNSNVFYMRLHVSHANETLHGSFTVHATRYKDPFLDTPYLPDSILDIVKTIMIRSDALPQPKLQLIMDREDPAHNPNKNESYQFIPSGYNEVGKTPVTAYPASFTGQHYAIGTTFNKQVFDPTKILFNPNVDGNSSLKPVPGKFDTFRVWYNAQPTSNGGLIYDPNRDGGFTTNPLLNASSTVHDVYAGPVSSNSNPNPIPWVVFDIRLDGSVTYEVSANGTVVNFTITETASTVTITINKATEAQGTNMSGVLVVQPVYTLNNVRMDGNTIEIRFTG